MDGITTEVKEVNETEMSSVLEIAALLFCVGNSSTSEVEEAYETKSKKKFALDDMRVVSNYQSEI